MKKYRGTWLGQITKLSDSKGTNQSWVTNSGQITKFSDPQRNLPNFEWSRIFKIKWFFVSQNSNKFKKYKKLVAK